MRLSEKIAPEILKIVEKSPTLQSEFTRLLGIKHDQRIAEAVKILISTNKITREKYKLTYILKPIYKQKTYRKFPFKTSPCFGCSCHGDTEKLNSCMKLNDWLRI